MKQEDLAAFFLIVLAVVMGTLAKRAKQLEQMFSKQEPVPRGSFLRMVLIEGMTVPCISILTFSAVASNGMNLYWSLAIGCLAGFGGLTTINIAWEIFKDALFRIIDKRSN